MTIRRKRSDNLCVNLLIRHIKTNKKLYKSFNFSYHTQKYTLRDVLTDIVYVMKTGISYRNLRSAIKWQTIYKVYRKLISNKVFNLTYNQMLKKYVKRGGLNRKLRYISTDTTFIMNKNGSEKIGLNKYYYKKKGNKISLVVDSNKKIIEMKIFKGGKNDTKILEKHLESDMIIDRKEYEKIRNILYVIQDMIQR